jgi:hypothetical protein
MPAASDWRAYSPTNLHQHQAEQGQCEEESVAARSSGFTEVILGEDE